ncbi:ankyrin repeat-containing domain protein [Amylocarpus encephaloides]|uniref:GPI inositol-deacylase n=1 Tax=Amylocarpus encephaloides TaxID=45428 RepID=A0A9P8C5B7_9HELO|nr:ankyrin repeat-containing domain protein [Amylocarpus encephaloides]
MGMEPQRSTAKTVTAVEVQKTPARLKLRSIFRAKSKSPHRTKDPSSNVELEAIDERVPSATLAVEETLEARPTSFRHNIFHRHKSPKQDPADAEDPSKFGLFTLHEPPSGLHSDEQHPVDIIALHGINGKAFKTWTYVGKQGKETFWLRDFLPVEFPGARVYTYGYNAKILSMGTGTLESFSRTLLELIMDKRRTRKEQRRPIIFICHSMGGLVVKKALTMANAPDCRQRNVRTSTSAIIFIATPHRGSEPAAILARAATIGNGGLVGTGISRFKGRTRDDLIRDLSLDSPVLIKINSDFGPMTDGSIKFYSFIEDLTATGLNTRIVNEYSGQMGVEAEVVIDMGGEDHKSIARYKSEKSQSYRKVLAKLQEAVREAVEPIVRTMRDEDLPCLQSLAFPTMTHRKQEVIASHQNSCQWILTHPSFTTWNNNDKGLLWIKGHPGTGKSTLMAFIHSRLTASSRSIRLEFFFSGRGQPLQKSVLGMFRSLLYQLYDQSSDAREAILEAFEEKRGLGGPSREWNWQVDELRGLLTKVVKEVSMKVETTFFVDALDEAVFESGEKAAIWLVEYFYELNDAMVGREQDGSVRGVRICISCRHYPVVGSLGSGLEVHVEKENGPDIIRYVEHQLKSTMEGWNEVDPREAKMLVDAIVRKTFGVFLWAVLNVPRIVERLNDGRVTVVQASRLVKDESNELFSLYASILKHDVSERVRKKSLLFLQWICLAIRPLSLAELRFAMACDDQDNNFSRDCCEMDAKDFVNSDAQMKRLVKSMSAGLAEVLESGGTNKVQFIHETVNDFLRQGGLATISSLIRTNIVVDPIRASHSRLAWCCANYLRIDNVLDALGAWAKWDDPRPVFIEYAAKYLFVHTSRAQGYSGTQERLINLLSTSPELLDTWKRVLWKLVYKKKEYSGQEYTYSCELIHIAAQFNVLDLMAHLLPNTTLLMMGDIKGSRALHLAAAAGHSEMCKLLVDHEADLDATDDGGATAMELAAQNGYEWIVKMLLDHGANVNGSTATSKGALQAAIESRNMPLIRVLLDAGADVNARQGTFGYPLQHAGPILIPRDFSRNLVRLLLDRGANINAQGGRALGTVLHEAIWYNNELLIDLLLERGANVRIRGEIAETVLQAAAFMSNWTLAIKLVGMGADVHALGGEHGSALHVAVRSLGNEEFIELLLAKGFDINVKVGVAGSALATALSGGHEKSFHFLLKHGADLKSIGGQFDNALQAAVAGRNKQLIEYILDLDTDVNTHGGVYGSALQAAIVWHRSPPIKQLNLVSLLLSRGADVNLKGRSYGSPLYAAVSFKNEDLVYCLLKAGADPNLSVGEELGTMFPNALQYAASQGNLNIIQMLLDFGAEINRLDTGSQGLDIYTSSPLNVAAIKGDNAVVKFLLERGATLKPYNGCYTEALRAAAESGHMETVKLLLQTGTGADPQHDARAVMLAVKGGERQAPSHY